MRRAAALAGPPRGGWFFVLAATGGTGRRPVPAGRALLGRGTRLLGGGSGVAVEQRRGRVQHILGELALRGEQLLDEVVRVGHPLARLGQLFVETEAHL